MKKRIFAVISLLAFLSVGTGLFFRWNVEAEEAISKPADSIPAPRVQSETTANTDSKDLREDPRSNRQTILLWPKKLTQFKNDYSSWEMWLGDQPTSAYLLRDELVVSIRALATIIPDLKVETDEPNSDLIIVSGNRALLATLLSRLQDHPLLAQVTEDSPIRYAEARIAWAKSRPDTSYETSDTLMHVVNIRNSWVTNIVWGYTTPGATVYITLTRNISHVLVTTATANFTGLYHAYLIWEINEGDIIQINDGSQARSIPVVPLRPLSDTSSKLVTGSILNEFQSLDVVVGKASRSVSEGSDGAFAADFSAVPFHPGDPGFLRYTDAAGNRIFQPFSVPIVNVRRDTSNGNLPYGSAHSEGISSVVWGSATPNDMLTITLTRAGGLVITRTVAADHVGDFSVSMDHLIDDGDVVQVRDGVSVRTVQVPTMTFLTDTASKMVTGTAPAGIITTLPGAPHSFEVSIAGDSRQVTTTADGKFSADFTGRPYLAGLLGTLRYTTPSSDRVYKPLFATEPFVRGKLDDWHADVILGQPDFSQITPDEVVGKRLFNPMGVYVDRSAQPNRIYVYDSGNSRVLGLSHLGTCLAGANIGQDCTSTSDCPGSTCQVQETRLADIVLGQPSFNTSACNNDSGYQIYPDVLMASAETLCGLPEFANSVSESGSGATMATDTQGNLYVTDFYNNRVLRYNSPFTTDTIADYVWGQASFSGTTCNRGAGFYKYTDAKSLCLTPPPGIGDNRAGVAVDSAGNLWVTDNENNRVLRFPFNPTLGLPAQEANLVLGQPDFSTFTGESGLNQMHKPNSIRVGSNGVVYVSDSSNDRVLVFEPPFSNGMPATRVITSGLVYPRGLELDPAGGLWVNDSNNQRLVRFVNETIQNIITPIDVDGGLGIDRDGNIMAVGWQLQQGLHYAVPAYALDATFLRAEPASSPNQIGPQGLQYGRGLEVAAGQIIYGDRGRLLFWNNPYDLVNFQSANGVVGAPDFHTRVGPEFGRMRADGQGRLWVIYSGGGLMPVIRGYSLPLQTGATPIFTLTSPLPLLGGGVFTWTEGIGLSGIDVQPDCDCLWLADTLNNRAFRIRNVSSDPTVDIVLGQKDISGIHCNHGRDPDDGYAHPISPTQDSLCHPGALAFDRSGNLYLADHNLEVAGNWRLLEFDASTLPATPLSAVFGISATHVLGRNGSFTESNCHPGTQDPMCGPWEPVFDSQDRMVIGFNGYLGPPFPMVYQDPLANPLPIAALGDLHSMPLSIRFDQFDNLYTLDHNRSRILVYQNRHVQTYIVTGTIKTSDGDPVPGVLVETLGYASNNISNASGVYTLTGLVTGTFVLKPSKDFYSFSPITRTISLPGVTSGQDFTAIAGTSPSSMTFSGPTTGTLNMPLVFTATVSPITTTLPLNYTWQARRQAPVTHTSGLSDTIMFTWDTPGAQTITVTAQNAGGAVTATHIITTYTPPVLVTINAISPSPPQCVLRNSSNLYDRLLELTGENFSTTEHNLQFRRVVDGSTSLHFHMEVSWISTTQIAVDMGLIKDLLWPDSRVILNARVTNSSYEPVSDWSPEFILADDATACSTAQSHPLTSVAIEGSTSGSIQTNYAFTATVSPITATQPITYVWQAAGQLPITNTGNLSNTANFVWDTPGAKAITVTAMNSGGVVSDSHTIIIYTPPAAVVINGPASGIIQANYTFTATVNPITTSLPVTYSWQATGQLPVTNTSNLSDTATFAWILPGTQTVTVTATNVQGIIANTHVITISALPPVAKFIADPTSGASPLIVTFTDTSVEMVDTWHWDFGDTATSSQTNPTHTYTIAGVYTVTLSVGGPGGTNTLARTNCITVYTPVEANFTASPISGIAPLTVAYTNTSTGDYIANLWSFGDGETSTLANPTHTYTHGGIYTVTLTISGPGGTDLESKAALVTVTEQHKIYLPVVLRNS